MRDERSSSERRTDRNWCLVPLSGFACHSRLCPDRNPFDTRHEPVPVTRGCDTNAQDHHQWSCSEVCSAAMHSQAATWPEAMRAHLSARLASTVLAQLLEANVPVHTNSAVVKTSAVHPLVTRFSVLSCIIPASDNKQRQRARRGANAKIEHEIGKRRPERALIGGGRTRRSRTRKASSTRDPGP